LSLNPCPEISQLSFAGLTNKHQFILRSRFPGTIGSAIKQHVNALKDKALIFTGDRQDAPE